MKSRVFFTAAFFALLLCLPVLPCSAGSILQYDTDGNISMSSTDDPGESGGDGTSGSSDDQSSGAEVMPAVLYTTADGYEYHIIETANPLLVHRLCILLVPGAVSSDEFLEKTQWADLGGMYGFDIVLLQYDWADETAASAYYESVYHELSYNIEEDSQLYLIGYEDSSDFASLEAALHTVRYTGLAAIGGNGLSEERMEELDEQAEQRPLSVWIVAKDKTSDIYSNINYWKSVNSVISGSMRSFQTLFADTLYLSPTSTAGKIPTDENRMGIVLFSKAEDYYDPGVSGNIAINFISQVEKNHACFSDGITGSDVVSINDRHFTYNRLQINGQQRDYWVYIPDTVYTSEEPGSLILCLHGNMGTGEDMIFQSRWHEVAAENHSIIVFPYSLYKRGSQHYWQNLPEEIEFIRALIDTVTGKFRIDTSRIYVTGFSNGAGMAQNLAIRCSDIFAAAVMSAPAYYEKDFYGPVDHVHEVAVLYTYGTRDEYLVANGYTPDIDDLPALRKMQYWRKMYGFDQDSYETAQFGNYTVYSFRSPNGLYVCHWTRVEGKNHDYADEEVPYYFDFMQHYTKGPDGELYYDGQLVESQLTLGAEWDEYTEEPIE